MTEPLDLAELRAHARNAIGASHSVDAQLGGYLLAACDELDRLRLRETTLQFTLDTERGENERLRAALLAAADAAKQAEEACYPRNAGEEPRIWLERLGMASAELGEIQRKARSAATEGGV